MSQRAAILIILLVLILLWVQLMDYTHCHPRSYPHSRWLPPHFPNRTSNVDIGLWQILAEYFLENSNNNNNQVLSGRAQMSTISEHDFYAGPIPNFLFSHPIDLSLEAWGQTLFWAADKSGSAQFFETLCVFNKNK